VKLIDSDESVASRLSTPLDFLQAVYGNEGLPMATRLKAAIEAAPFVHPKLAATFDVGRALGRRMEEAIAKAEGRLPDAGSDQQRGA
jgi:hypothetical protein